jgi:hypothetical protein
MFIIYGTRGVKFTKEEGVFKCPNCICSRPYRLRSIRRFATLFFIPIIPLDKLGEYVECEHCLETYIPRVLDEN